MDFLRRLARCSRLEEIRNNVIREKRILKIYAERFSRRILGCCSPGRARNSWMQEVTTGMREMRINILEWIDREGWTRKIKLKLQVQNNV